VTASSAGSRAAHGDESSRTLRLTVSGPLDATIKKLARYEVVTLTSREPDLEDVFLAFYGERFGHVDRLSGGTDEEAGGAA
jgi:hypothetical protein